MVKKLTLLQRKALVKALSSKRVSNVTYKNGYIALKFDGRKLRNKALVKHDYGIADWSRKRKEVHYDEKLKEKDVLPILVHETVEKYVTEKYRLAVKMESHKIAQGVERRFISEKCTKKQKKNCKHSGRCWRLHEQRIDRLWKKENSE